MKTTAKKSTKAVKKLPFGIKKETKPTAGSGNFQKLAGGIAKSEVKAGKSPDVAQKIGAAVAAKIGVKRFGQKAMTKAAVAGKKLAAKKRK